MKKHTWLYLFVIIVCTSCEGLWGEVPFNNLALSLPEKIAPVFTTSKAQWQPVEREFDGVIMVLVPTGCFMMGSTDGESNEKPVSQQCFNQPFWMDKYEVTQRQFMATGGQKANPNFFTGDNLPVDRVTWFEARDYCKLRGGRLPTEAEWEYAARGPDNLIYPWGNEFVAENVVYYRTSNNTTIDVGSRPKGISWVGALDLSGNVWEWTLSEYKAYPYDAIDGRNDDTTQVNRVLRGGSWYDSGTQLFRGAFRLTDYFPDFTLYTVGFRCSRFDLP